MPLYEPLINRTYFEGSLSIGQVDQQQVEDELLEFIRKHEYDFLINLMGLPLYQALYSGMQGPAIDVRWQRMAYGEFFLLDASNVKNVHYPYYFNYGTALGYNSVDKLPVNYRGLLKRPDNFTPAGLIDSGYGATSPIAKYVYYYWNIAHATNSGGSGEVLQAVHNGERVNNAYKFVKAWNEMAKEVTNFYYFLDMNIELYPEFNLPDSGRFFPKLHNRFSI